ncbi:DUF4142 domain-containing protein [Sphingobacterium deserti]|nr:DUF4142 domain-containing protein [Sphingobacterium deserti]
MKKIAYILAISAAASGLQACGSGSATANNMSDSTAMSTDSMHMHTDSMSMDSMVMDSMTMQSSAMDTTFVNTAAIAGMAEVQMSELAQQHASHAKVKEFANMMVTDHSRANAELKQIAGSKNLMLPEKLDKAHMDKLTMLKSKKGAEFDKAYVMAMVEGHEKTVALMEQGSMSLKDADLKKFATKTTPVVKSHLEAIKKIKSEMK